MDRRLAVGGFVLAVALVASTGGFLGEASAHHYEESPIQPGAELSYPGLCSLNFVFEDPDERLFIGTAGHCVSHEGQYVIPADFDQAIGQVHWIGEGLDFALIEIAEHLYDRVDPQVRHWGGPTGVALQSDTQAGDLVLHYGNGVYFQESELTTARAGILADQTAELFCTYASVYGGDSGSPMITADGQALGVNTHIPLDECTPPTSLAGPTIEHALEQAEAQKGLKLDVVTAEMTDPMDREADRLAHLP